MLQCRVFPVLVFTAMFLFSLIGVSFGKEKYGKCIKYAIGESKPALNGDRYCLTSGKYVYCREVECPATQCVKPLVPSHGACLYCPGTCSYGGAIYQIKDRVLNLDGANGCTCRAKNVLRCTKVGQMSAKNMCFKKHRLE
ncbi:Hypothetical predicted protein [Mytilus galloprovincialis]|uniref:Uncharacterized protein n=1 Tax=Mytilus galloprovincialis TaxID=29158 RepID=A0A8B6EYA7_MYTGA|nr:Hypothetical predicted protein [Mytilus galloprovincialis]